jgi:hypothetical protein
LKSKVVVGWSLPTFQNRPWPLGVVALCGELAKAGVTLFPSEGSVGLMLGRVFLPVVVSALEGGD